MYSVRFLLKCTFDTQRCRDNKERTRFEAIPPQVIRIQDKNMNSGKVVAFS